MVVEGRYDGEGPLVASVREVVGADVPIIVTLDLHGNITDELVAEADALVAYETYLHIDTGDTGHRAMELLLQTVRREVDPVMSIERPPLSPVTPLQNPREGLMAEVMSRARELERRDDLLKVNVLPGFSRSDVLTMGFSIPVVADGNPRVARETSRGLAAEVWEMRESFVGDFPEPGEAVAEAIEHLSNEEADDGPVVLADVGDNPGGGGTADSTPVLRALLGRGIRTQVSPLCAIPRQSTPARKLASASG